MITEKVRELLLLREFIAVGTSNLNGRPNSAPKFLVKIENNFIYLADFVIGNTFENLKINPKASLSFMNFDNLTGYQINGSVEIINSGQEYDKIIEELEKRKTSLTTKHIIEEIRGGGKYNEYEIAFPDRVVIFKVKIEEVVEIGPRGKLAREKS